MPACRQGDARERAAYEALLQGRPVDLLLTDPPYCLLTRRRKGGDVRDPHGRKIDRDPVLRFEDVKTYRRFTDAWVPLALATVKPDGLAVIWTNVLGKPPLVEAAAKAGFGHLWGEFIWAKRTKDANSSEQLLRVYETALVLSRRPAPAVTDASGPQVWAAVTGYDDEGEGKEWGDHPHHKPFSSLEPLLRAYSRPGDVVLDPFAGSGSIPVAAQRLGREAFGIELKADWAARVAERLSAPGALTKW
jgi:site-specific DNA-methyltransferase (adenine-specific)